MIIWTTNRDGAFVCRINGVASGGVWRGAWIDDHGNKVYGFLAASWVPAYHRVGKFPTAAEARSAVEDDLAP